MQCHHGSLVLRRFPVHNALVMGAMSSPDPDLAGWVRRLTVGLAKLPDPPTEVHARQAGGLVLLLRDVDGSVVQLWLMPRGDGSPAYFEGRRSLLRYLGQISLTARQERWVKEVCQGLLRVERQQGWEQFLIRSAQEGAAPSVGAASNRRVTSGDAALLRVTTRCQARCDFCSSLGVLHDLVGDLADVRTRVASAVREGRRTVSFTGGEPTLRRDLPELVAAAKDEGISGVELQTNGILLARRARVKRLAEAGLSCVFLSLHSGDAATHDELLHVSGAHEKAVEGASHALEAGLQVVVNHVITRHNLAGLPLFPGRIAGVLGPVAIRLSVMAPEGGGARVLDWMPRLSEAAPFMSRAIDAGVALGMDMKIPGLCGVPPCIIPGYEAHFEELQDVASPPRLITRRQVEACQACPHQARCSGYWTAYLERHGDGEVGPVWESTDRAVNSPRNPPSP